MNSEYLPTLISVSLFLIIIIVLIVTGKARWIISFHLCGLAIYPITIGLIFIYASPKNYHNQGSIIPLIPLTVGAIIIGLFILSLFLNKRKNPLPNILPPKTRWVFLVIGFIIIYLALFLSLIGIYAPKSIGSSSPLPNLPIYIWYLCSILVAVIFYRISKMNTQNNPNLFRWLVLVLIYYSMNFYILTFIMIFIYAMPAHVCYPFPASMLTVAFIPPSLVLTGLSKDYVKILK